MQHQGAELRLRYDDDLFYLALASSSVRNWMRNGQVATWLREHHPKSAALFEGLAREADFASVPGRPMKLPYSTNVSRGKHQKSRRKVGEQPVQR
jgi:hypothetical protein